MNKTLRIAFFVMLCQMNFGLFENHVRGADVDTDNIKINSDPREENQNFKDYTNYNFDVNKTHSPCPPILINLKKKSPIVKPTKVKKSNISFLGHRWM